MRIRAIFLGCLFLMGVYISAEAAYVDGGMLLGEMYKASLENNQSMSEEDKTSIISDEYETVLGEVSWMTSDGEVMYDDCYGGAYVEGDKLIVCIVPAGELSSQARSINSVSDVTETRIVEYSYNHLSAVYRLISDEYASVYQEFKDDNSALGQFVKSIVGIELNQISNRVIVYLPECSEENMNLFKTIFSYDTCIVFSEDASASSSFENWKLGRAIYAIVMIDDELYLSRMSTGYRARWEIDGETAFRGFVTCQHGVNERTIDTIFADSNLENELGTVLTEHLGGTVDAAFVHVPEEDWQYTVVNQCYYFNSDGGTRRSPVIEDNVWMTSVADGAEVKKVGATTYLTKGDIASTSYTATLDGTTLENLTRVKMVSDHGDSGGIVYRLYEGEMNIVAGIVTGGYTSFWGVHYTLYTKASEVGAVLDVFPY